MYDLIIITILIVLILKTMLEKDSEIVLEEVGLTSLHEKEIIGYNFVDVPFSFSNVEGEFQIELYEENYKNKIKEYAFQIEGFDEFTEVEIYLINSVKFSFEKHILTNLHPVVTDLKAWGCRYGACSAHYVVKNTSENFRRAGRISCWIYEKDK